MAATIKDLGKVTAYAYAKAAGYTGTEEQFQTIFNEFTEEAPGLMDRLDAAVARAEAAVADIDSTIQDAVDDAVDEATASAVATANQAVTDAQAAQTAAEGAVTQANAAVTQANNAVTAAQAAQSAAEDAAESFVLDRTLTDPGAAAPADLVGDLTESISEYGFKYYQSISSVNGLMKFSTDIAGLVQGLNVDGEPSYILRANRNFLRLKAANYTGGGKTIISGTDNTITLSGTSTGGTWLQSPTVLNCWLPKGTFRLKVDVVSGSATSTSSYAPFRIRVTSGLMSSYLSVYNESKSTTFTNSTAGNKSLEIGTTTGTYTDYKVQIQIAFTDESETIIAPNGKDYASPYEVETIEGTNYIYTSDGTEFTLKYPVAANEKLGDIDVRVQDTENEIDEFDTLFYQSNYVKNFNASQYVKPFTDLLVSATGKSDAFLWFTDPHVLINTSTWKQQYMEYLEPLHRMYLLTPTSFTLCGGDWLTENESDEVSGYKLGLADGRMRKNFYPYHPTFGNHDSNEQGTTTFTQNQIVNLMFQQEGRAYYQFETPQATYFVLDSGTDHSNGMTIADRWTQIDWLGKCLEQSKPENAVIVAHILYVSTSGGSIIPSLIENAQLLCNAYNNHTTITLNSISYDFTGATGKVRYMIGGHMHNDRIWESDATTPIPMVITANLKHMSGVTTPTFDLMVADYGAGVLKSLRIGSPFLDDSTTTGITLTMA